MDGINFFFSQLRLKVADKVSQKKVVRGASKIGISRVMGCVFMIEGLQVSV